MTPPARHSTAETSAYGAFDLDEDYAPEEFFPGERIGPPRTGIGGSTMLRGGIVILIALGGGLTLLSDQATWPGWLSADIAAVFASMDHREPGSVDPANPTGSPANAGPTTNPAALDPPPSTPQPLATSEIAATPGAAAGSAAIAPTATDSDEPPAPPVRPPPADHYQKRAAAVGLHPDLSRVLLERLSPADYHNAGIAIQTAVAKTPDTDVFVWPRQRKAKLALFEVRFVPGAALDCRRYVVTVTKDGWSTTAMPMEKCGSSPAGRRATGASVE